MSAFNAFSSILSPSWKSMARLVLPSRLELKRPEGSSNEAPLAKVIFTTFLYVSPVQIIPACDHTGTPRHFHSSTTSWSACLMRSRIRASVSPRQSLSSLILASIRREGEAPPVPFFEPLFVFMVVVPRLGLVHPWAQSGRSGPATSLSPRTGFSHSFAGQFAGLLHPRGDLSFVEFVLVDVVVAHVLVLGLAGGNRTQRCAAEEGHFDVLRKAMEAEEPALALDAIEGRVPLDCLAHARDSARDERVEAAPDVAFPAWASARSRASSTRFGRYVGPHGSIAMTLRDLRVAP